jgi:hypothetical protein
MDTFLYYYAAALAQAACQRPGRQGALLATPPLWRGMEEVRHTGLVTLVDFGPGHSQLLWHRGTGEHVALAGRWALSLADGLAMLTPEGGPGDAEQPAWANAFLDTSLQKGPAGTADEGKVFIWSKSRQAHQDKAILGTQIRARVFKHSAGGVTFSSEVYEHTVPTDALQRLYWTTPWLQDFILGPGMHNKWACRNYKSWVDLLRRTINYNTCCIHAREDPQGNTRRATLGNELFAQCIQPWFVFLFWGHRFV